MFQPTYDAIFSTLPLWCRWRLLVLQPLNILIPLITSPYWLFNNRYSVIYVPTRSGPKRCLVFKPPRTSTMRGTYDGSSAAGKYGLPPLHIDVHGGAFIGGYPEQSARFCSLLSDRTGAVVVSCTYRVAPKHTYPAAHDDIDDIFKYIIEHALKLGADPHLVTVGGSSAGGNLSLSGAVSWNAQDGHPEEGVLSVFGKGHRIKAYLGMYAPINLHPPPQDKIKPPDYPTKDPLKFLLPLFDTYAGANRQQNWNSARLHPTLSAKSRLPKDILFIVAGKDILLYEQLKFVERIGSEIRKAGEENNRSIEAEVYDKAIHGWLESE